MTIAVPDSQTVTLTPWSENIDAANFNLINVGYFESNAGTPAPNGVIRLGVGEEIMWKSTVGQDYIKFVNNLFTIAPNNSPEYTFNPTQADWNGNSLINFGYLESNHATPATSGQVRLGLSEEIAWGASNDVIRFDTGNRLEIRPAGINQYDFNPTQADWKGNNLINVGYFESNAGTPALNGAIRLGNAELIAWRNAANSANLSLSVNASDNLEISDGFDIQLNATTGTKIATATTQKIGFWNATPVVQPVHIADATGGATVDTEARAAINSLLAQMATLGLQAAA